MKYFKVIGLAALAALALMTVGVASASANAKVCSASGTGEGCGGTHGKHYAGSLVAKSVGNVVLTVTNISGSNINTVTCTASEIAGQITSGTTGTAQITKLSLSECKSNVCGAAHVTTTASSAHPWNATARTHTSGVTNTNGFLDVSSPTLTFTCNVFGIPVTCAYKAATATATITGSASEPKLSVFLVPLERESGPENTCGVKVHWSGTYKVTTPSSLYIL